jgi:hypothetical protein
MSEVSDFLSEMGQHNYDPQAADTPLRPEDLADGVYVAKLTAINPRKIEKLNGWVWDWTVVIQSGPGHVGRAMTYGTLLTSDYARNRLGLELERLGLRAADFPGLLRVAMDSLPKQILELKKSQTVNKMGKTYHNIEAQSIVGGDPSLPF